ncbi:MAG: hypothetical protein QXW97_03785 [Candidatus Pacearchaeota archaeon]
MVDNTDFNFEKKSKEMSPKEQRIKDITLMYYSRTDVRKAIFEFSKNRECVPRYFEGFGKRPDSFQYDKDILDFVKKGATSFHCSEELWKDPLEISTDLSKSELDDLRLGWDLLLDIDSLYLEYSKIYAELVVEALKFHGIKNIGVKFSGSKGFHIIVPWKAFPKEVYGQSTKNMFPDWPRFICEYLSEVIKDRLEERILKYESLKEISERTGKKIEELIFRKCISCNRAATKKNLITWFCDYCKKEIINIEGTFNNRKKSKCPDCRKDLIEKKREEIYTCDFCKTNSKKNPEMFASIDHFATEKLIDADLVLVSPRHLFRMPYSLHEKTALVSVVIDENKIRDFEISNARHLKIEIKNYYPDVIEGEAKELLLQALDWNEQKEKKKKIIENQKSNLKIDEKIQVKSEIRENFKKTIISNPSDFIFPPCIKIILRGFNHDGKKRALFILINFFKTLGVSENELEKRIESWNEKNEPKLKKGYIQSQLAWFNRNSAKMPPNCINPIYNDIGVCKPDDLCKMIKNPVNYAFKKYFKKMR